MSLPCDLGSLRCLLHRPQLCWYCVTCNSHCVLTCKMYVFLKLTRVLYTDNIQIVAINSLVNYSCNLSSGYSVLNATKEVGGGLFDETSGGQCSAGLQLELQILDGEYCFARVLYVRLYIECVEWSPVSVHIMYVYNFMLVYRSNIYVHVTIRQPCLTGNYVRLQCCCTATMFVCMTPRFLGVSFTHRYSSSVCNLEGYGTSHQCMDNLQKEDKSSAPKMSFIRRFHCSIHLNSSLHPYR